MHQGGKPSLEDVAAEALVSRATAYRNFPAIEALPIEATLDVASPDPVARVEKVDAAFETTMSANETGLRMMLAQSLQRSLAEEGGTLPKRQNRRAPLIEAALASSRREFSGPNCQLLTRALALVIGTEGLIVFKNVPQLSDSDARKVRRWAIRALIEAARKWTHPASTAPSSRLVFTAATPHHKHGAFRTALTVAAGRHDGVFRHATESARHGDADNGLQSSGRSAGRCARSALLSRFDPHLRA